MIDAVAGSSGEAAGSGLWGPTLVAALVAAAVALFTLTVNQIRARRDRQRELFAEAFAAVSEYREFPFIVRRRDETGLDRQQITRDLSAVQARLNHYAARLRIESARVGRAYEQLVAETRRVAGAEISRSWDMEPVSVCGGMHVRDVDLSALDDADEAFLTEVADHLTVVPGPVRRAIRMLRAWRQRRDGAPDDPSAEARQ